MKIIDFTSINIVLQIKLQMAQIKNLKNEDIGASQVTNVRTANGINQNV